MSIPATEPVTPTPGMYTPAQAPQANGDKDMFLQLMVAQLRYQDPMNPTDSSQFLSQNAQFTALEKMQDVADKTAQLFQAQISFGASGLIGKSVSWTDSDGVKQSGTVHGVTFGASGPVLDVDGASVTLAQIQSIGTSASAPASSGSTTA